MEQQQERLTSQQLIDRIKPRLYSTVHQADRIKNLMKKPVAGDICICWYSDLTDIISPGKDETASAPITVSLAESLHLTVDDLLRLGQEHAQGTYRVQSMHDIMGSLIGIPDEYETGSDSTPMYVIGSRSLQFGAAAILDKGIQEQLHKLYPEGYFCIPASIHEWICVPKNSADLSSLVAMVQEINGNDAVIQPQDVLSNHVYTLIEGQITFAA